jgi:ribosome maturation factor RimP
VTAKTREQLVPNSHRIDGELVRADEESATLATEGGEVEVPYEQVKAARTVFEWGAKK